MRAAIALLLIAGCASSSSSDHRLGMWVNEIVANGHHAPYVIGPHNLRLHVENRSQQEITVQSIRIEAAGIDLDSEDGGADVNQLVGPGETSVFDVYLTVSTRGQSKPSGSLTEVNATIGGTLSDGKTFTDGGRFFIGREDSGR